MDELGRFMYDAEVRGTFLFFGSARTQDKASQQATYAKLQADLAALQSQREAVAAAAPPVASGEAAPRPGTPPPPSPLQVLDAKIKKATAAVSQCARREWAHETYDKTKELARLLTIWAMSPEGRNVGLRCASAFETSTAMRNGEIAPLVVCTGGGPGYMQAANEGAFQVPDGRSMGVGIILPFETHLNDFIRPRSLGIDAQFFFSRKYWEVFSAKAVICAPGGVGTLDELFEVMTLLQCEKMQKLPIVLIGKEFWSECAKFLHFVADKGMMTHEEVHGLCITDSPQEAFEHIRTSLIVDAERNVSPTKRSRESSMN